MIECCFRVISHSGGNHHAVRSHRIQENGANTVLVLSKKCERHASAVRHTKQVGLHHAEMIEHCGEIVTAAAVVKWEGE